MTRTPNLSRRHYLRDRSASSAVEFALVITIFVVFLFGIIDFSRAFWEWNRAAKATQEGARFAVVNDPVAAGLADFDGLAFGGAGASVPLSSINPNPVVCDSNGCNGYGFDSAAHAAILNRVSQFYPRASEAGVEVVVEYEHIGLGFIGNPFGPDIAPAVTVKLQGLQFPFITPGLNGIANLTMPEFAATITAEDLEN